MCETSCSILADFCVVVNSSSSGELINIFKFSFFDNNRLLDPFCKLFQCFSRCTIFVVVGMNGVPYANCITLCSKLRNLFHFLFRQRRVYSGFDGKIEEIILTETLGKLRGVFTVMCKCKY